jgi:hypothetical protein
LLLDFLSGPLDSRITFTRASTATFFNSAGTLTSASNDVARFDYDPATLAPLGLLIEESRTNSIRNNTMVGAVAGTPGTVPTGWSTFTSLTGLTSQVVGTGTESGITYLDFRLSGTPSAAGVYFLNFESTTQAAASSGQAWTSSAYYKLQAGSLIGITSAQNAVSARNAVGADLSSITATFVPTSSALNTQRVTSTITSNPASTAFETQFLRLNLSGVAIDITLRIGLPQLEQGAFATSVIPTTTTALTRNADVASMTGTNFSSWYNAVEGTLFVDFQTRSPQIDAVPVTTNDGTNNNRIGFDITSTGFGREVVDSGGSSQALIGTGGLVSGAANKMAAVYKVNDFSIVKNGGSASTDVSGTVPTVTQLSIGSRVSTLYLNSTIRSIRYYPVRLPDSTLQALTA